MTLGFDCALFDVDGVLVDIRRSYNAAIKKTVEYMLDNIAGKENRAPRNLVTDRIILKFRQSGGFNNDTDTSYAITLAMLAGPAEKKKGALAARRFLAQVAENADDTGYVSVEKFLASQGCDVEKYKGMLVYPAPVRESPIARVFDELFYGPELFRKQNGGLEPKYWQAGMGGRSRPMIKNDRLAVSARTMKSLNRIMHGNLAMVTGRSRLAAEYSLGPLMKYFNVGACVFLEDEKREHAKPSPYAAIKAMQVMGAKSAVYAGDSAEDMLMARRAEREAGVRIAFVGIYGYSPRPAETARRFRKDGADAVARNVGMLPCMIAKKKLLR